MKDEDIFFDVVNWVRVKDSIDLTNHHAPFVYQVENNIESKEAALKKYLSEILFPELFFFKDDFFIMRFNIVSSKGMKVEKTFYTKEGKVRDTFRALSEAPFRSMSRADKIFRDLCKEKNYFLIEYNNDKLFSLNKSFTVVQGEYIADAQYQCKHSMELDTVVINIKKKVDNVDFNLEIRNDNTNTAFKKIIAQAPLFPKIEVAVQVSEYKKLQRKLEKIDTEIESLENQKMRIKQKIDTEIESLENQKMRIKQRIDEIPAEFRLAGEID